MPELRIAIIGAGISGIATARILQKNGFEAVIFEKSAKLGGVWSTAYPGIHLQNIYPQYHLSDFPWPFQPDFHPTGEQILRYLHEAVQHFQLDVRLQHQVLRLEERPNGWLVHYQNEAGEHAEPFDFVIAATGQYTDGRNTPHFPGQEQFNGRILNERDVASLELFAGKRVAVVGFGKSALDMAVLAAAQRAQVHHIFRTPAWQIPERILGVHFTHALFPRFNSVMMTSWAQPTAVERFLHHRMRFVVSGFWEMITAVVRFQLKRHGKGKDQAAKDRLNVLVPTHKLLLDLRSSGALGPEDYYPLVVEGRILPYHSEVAGFSADAILLKNGQQIPCDLAVMSLGFLTPTFPFLPEKYRCLMEAENDGVQLYRHLLHPRIPHFAVSGFNHGFMHVPTVEVGTQWLCAYLRQEIELPPPEEMERSIEVIRDWKRENIRFEYARSCAVSTRYQQYIDILLKEMGVSPYRKMPNIFAEVFDRYEAADYQGIYEEYERSKARRTAPLRALPLDT